MVDKRTNFKGKDTVWPDPQQDTGDNLFIFEGFSDCLKALELSYNAFTFSGGVQSFSKLASAFKVQNRTVFLILDQDEPSKKALPKVFEAFLEAGHSVNVIKLPFEEGQGKDFCDWLKLHSPQDFEELLQKATLSATEASKSSPPKKPNFSTLSKEFILQCFYDDEVGDARFFAFLSKGRYVYDHATKDWYEFSTHWQKDKSKLIQETMRSLLSEHYLKLSFEADQEAAPLTISEDTHKEKIHELKKLREGLRRRCKDLNKLQRLKNILTIAQGGQFLGITGEEWDNNKWVLGTTNGVIDLKTGEFREQKPQDYLRKIAPILWKGINEPCPRWEQFQSEIVGEADSKEKPLTHFKQLLFGQAITGDKTEHIFPIIYGADGRNGKETEFETLKYVLGPLSQPINKDVLISSKRPSLGSPQPELYQLWGLRIAWLSESSKEEHLNVARVKHLTGGGTIVCRPLHGNIVSFEPSHTLFLFTNHKPHAEAEDSALWKRILLIEYPHTFVDEPSEPFHRKRDPNLKEKLKTEASGILAWMVKGCLLFQKEEFLKIPQKIKVTTQAYRESEDTLIQFVEECCIVAEPSKKYTTETKAGSLYIAYKNWVQEFGGKAMSNKAFGEQLSRKFEKELKRHGTIYYGILLKNGS